jgi:meso-butanediol dehydrogenase/(S,S)-butanediol dehydrogenase/diacetyl reductase
LTDRRFTDKTALVTGAASGIGRATAVRLASEGASAFCCDVDEKRLGDTAATIASAGGTAAAHRLDVSDAAACRAAVEACVARFGGLDVLCNVAGIMSWGHATEIGEAEWNRVVAVNLSGPFFLSQAASRTCSRRGA